MKPFKTGKDSSKEFLHWIDAVPLNTGLQIIALTYTIKHLHKDRTRIPRKKLSTPPRDFNVTLETNIENIGMPELLASSKTKQEIYHRLVDSPSHQPHEEVK